MDRTSNVLCGVLLAGCILLTMGAQVNAQSPQISEGVRVMMFTEKGARFGPDNARYMLLRQPPVYEYLPERECGQIYFLRDKV